MPTLTQVTGSIDLTREWRAAVVILTTAIGDDEAVWEHVSPGVSIDMSPLLADLGRPMRDRIMLAVAQGLCDGTTMVPFRELVALGDTRLRLVLDALAIARGSLPVD
jgi:hypothetical protein